MIRKYYAIAVTYNTHNDDGIIVVIFEYEISEKEWFHCHYDKERRLHYMEVQD